MVGSGSPDEAARSDRVVAPPASAMASSRSSTRSTDCTPPLLAIASPPTRNQLRSFAPLICRTVELYLHDAELTMCRIGRCRRSGAPVEAHVPVDVLVEEVPEP